MKLNGIELISYDHHGATANFVLECSFAKAATLDGEELIVTSNDDEIAVFGGYHITGVEKVGEHTRASFFKTVEPNIEQDIKAIQQNQVIQTKTATDLQNQIDELGSGLMEIATIISEGE